MQKRKSCYPATRFMIRAISILSVAVGCTISANATTITPTPQNFNFVVGTPVTNQTVASFTDSNNAAVPGNFTATINWGDGTTSAGSITGGPTFLVSGTHTYAVGGTFTVTVNISDVAPGAGTGTATGTATSVGTVISPSPHNFNFVVGTALTSQLVATFTDSNTAAAPGNFTATINWGDGTTSPGTIAGGPTFQVSGTHTYAVGGTFTVTVNIADAPGTGTATATGTATSVGTVISPSPHNFNFVVGTALTSQLVATFTDSNTAAAPANFAATINWGDGTTSPATIAGGPTFQVTGTHTYAVSGTFTVTVNISDAPGTGTGTATGTATSIGTVITASSHNFNFVAGMPLTSQLVATFTDSNTAAAPANFAATINWGDGTTSPGTITGGPTFQVSGTHTYAAGGTFTVTVTISDAPGTGSATATDTVSSITVPIMSFPALAGFALLLAGVGGILARKSALT